MNSKIMMASDKTKLLRLAEDDNNNEDEDDSIPVTVEKQPPAAALSDRLLGRSAVQLGGGLPRFIYPLLHTCLLFLLCVFLDWVVVRSERRLAAAMVDWMAHITLAAQSWFLAANLAPGRCFVLESAVYVCVLATVIDIDHFIAAWSLNPWSVLNCTDCPRGPLHNSLLLPIIVALFFAYEHGHLKYRGRPPAVCGLAWMTLVAWGSHQLRDGLRRGLLLWPLASTPALTFRAYAVGLVGLAWLVKCLMTALRYDVRAITIRPPPEELQLV